MAKIRRDDLRTIENLRALFEHSAMRYATATAFREKKDGFYQDISFSRFATEAEALGTALAKRLPSGGRVLLVGDNCYTWVLCFAALVCGAGVPVPVDASLSADAIAAIAARAQAKAVLYAADKATRIASLAHLDAICFDEIPALCEQGKDAELTGEPSIFEREIDRDEVAAIFFTAGTTGRPKGVLLSHAAICRTIADVGYMANLTPSDTFLSVLPLSHAYECICGMLVPLCYGACVAFSQGLHTLGRDLREIHPTAMVLLPFLATALYEKCMDRVRHSGNEAAVRRSITLSDPVRPLAARQALKEKLLADVRAFFGGKLNRILLVGGGTDVAVQKGLRSLGVFAVQAYGVTECAGLAAMNCDDSYKDGSAGKTMVSGVLDIYNAQPDGSGEIRYKGENLMLGYIDEDDNAAKALKDGWFYTGDMGRIDAEGFLHVIGRVQNCIETADGKRICPEELELLLCQSPFIREAAVVGYFDQEKQDNVAAAFLYPDFDYAKETLEADWVDLLDAAIEEWVEEINAELAEYENIALYVLREEPFPRSAGGKLLRGGLAAQLEELQATEE